MTVHCLLRINTINYLAVSPPVVGNPHVSVRVCLFGERPERGNVGRRGYVCVCVLARAQDAGVVMVEVVWVWAQQS